ncbi:Salicylate hydroxylase [Labilithrix luteola]|uniref:Salicylate hydroxylase n=1 Tax=Labilithrix luteola TaxID=1391654 RepID=A0A0K1PXW6_9BACT|nr:FAD binding domain-containing protein [Labilithrix luteola]AKU98373.1 Salicylate hydroxylase [Labilithrix luteola]
MKRRAIIIGGSLGGLFAAVLLREAGWTVDVYERSPGDLESRGGGIVLQPDVVEVFRRIGVDATKLRGVVARERVYLSRDGGVASLMRSPQTQTSWSALYSALREAFPKEHYHAGETLVSIEQDASAVIAHFEDGRSSERAELLVGADGAGSTVRQLMLPDIEVRYAGYVAFRGLVPEGELPAKAREVLSERFAFFEFPGSHILSYLVGGDDHSTDRGARRFNWVWYRNMAPSRLEEVMTDRDGRVRERSVPPGHLAPKLERELRAAADDELAWPFRDLVHATRDPFVQPILDLVVPRMVFGRVVLLGDAAFVPRPHTAASTLKAAANALMLVDALTPPATDLATALASWEPRQLLLGQELALRGKMLGDRSQFPNGR